MVLDISFMISSRILSRNYLHKQQKIPFLDQLNKKKLICGILSIDKKEWC
jgi:hypothetical protein